MQHDDVSNVWILLFHWKGSPTGSTKPLIFACIVWNYFCFWIDVLFVCWHVVRNLERIFVFHKVLCYLLHYVNTFGVLYIYAQYLVASAAVSSACREAFCFQNPWKWRDFIIFRLFGASLTGHFAHSKWGMYRISFRSLASVMQCELSVFMPCTQT